MNNKFRQSAVLQRSKSMSQVFPTSKLAEKRTVLRRQPNNTPLPVEEMDEENDENNSQSSLFHTDIFCIPKTDEPVKHSMDVTTAHAILSYMEMHFYKRSKVHLEWDMLKKTSQECDRSFHQSTLPQNQTKIRNANVVPYDHCRVCVGPANEYINASYIHDFDSQSADYVITQGPLKNTLCDFWQMIWESLATVIVNLSCLTESNDTLYDKYWPNEGAQSYGPIRVHLVSEHVSCDDYVVRSLYITHVKSRETRTITQFHYITWPQGRLPSSTSALLTFRRKVNKSFRPRGIPLIVHCSDGGDRSGMYVLIDLLLTRLYRGVREVDAAAALEHLRDHRRGLLSQQVQYEFVISCIADEVKATVIYLYSQR